MYKDTAKWLLAFIPTATLIGLAVALVPTIDDIRETGVEAWIGDHWVPAVAVAATVMAGVVATALCAYVLLAGPTPWNDLRDNETWLSKAFSIHAIGHPYFLDSGAFVAAEGNASLDLSHSAGEERETWEADRKAVAEVTPRIQELSATLTAQTRFKRFIWAYLIGVVVIVAGATTALVTSPSSADRVSKPTSVELRLPESAETTFAASTHCVSSKHTVAVAVSGTLRSPRLRLYGAGCTSAVWSPPRGLDVIAVLK